MGANQYREGLATRVNDVRVSQSAILVGQPFECFCRVVGVEQGGQHLEIGLPHRQRRPGHVVSHDLNGGEVTIERRPRLPLLLERYGYFTTRVSCSFFHCRRGLDASPCGEGSRACQNPNRSDRHESSARGRQDDIQSQTARHL